VSCRPCTRQTLCHRLVSVHVAFFFAKGRLSTQQRLCRVPERKHSANISLPSNILPCEVCRVWHSAKALPSALWPLGKEAESGSAGGR
jgi:hypothetical protein